MGGRETPLALGAPGRTRRAAQSGCGRFSVVNSLRIAITVDPYLPVPPTLYGGIERVVDFLAHGLVERGHEVTIYAHPESKTAGRHVAYGAPPHTGHWLRLK